MYGLNEKQFHKLFDRAAKMEGKAGFNLLCLLESRLDNIVYRMGIARTRDAARQLVNHGHITVNGKKVDIPSYLVSVGDVVAVKESSRNLTVIKASLESLSQNVPYVSVDKEKVSVYKKEELYL